MDDYGVYQDSAGHVEVDSSARQPVAPRRTLDAADGAQRARCRRALPAHWRYRRQSAGSTAVRHAHATTAKRKSRMTPINATRGNVKAAMPRRLRASLHSLCEMSFLLVGEHDFMSAVYDHGYSLSMPTVADL